MTMTALSLCWLLSAGNAGTESETPFRPPAVPLVVSDPYLSVWSPCDHLYDAWPMHWTGKVHAMAGMIAVDGKAMRFMGPDAVCPEAVVQRKLDVRPTQTLYTFDAAGVELTLTFTTPALPNAPDLLCCPVTFVTFDVRATDGKSHDVQIYFDATAEWAVNEPNQTVAWNRAQGPVGLTLLRVGTGEQPVLQRAGDGVRIDWGYFYLGVPGDAGSMSVITGHEHARHGFLGLEAWPSGDDTRQPRAAEDDWPVLACRMALGQVGEQAVRRHLVVTYDDLYSIEYMHQQLRPWWFKKYGSFEAMLERCAKDYEAILKQCADFDASTDAACAKYGTEYAKLAAMSLRHVFGSGKIVVGPNGDPWFFHKECYSNGCIATVDVSYPASPFFALFAPVLLRGMMEPIFDFASSDQWKFPFSPHDVGTYPKANGQAYNPGKLEGQMPVEECGNMILMAALVAKAEGDARYAEHHWKLLTQWAEYLKEKGLDPENQLCTDDFAGHLAHNANLSLKAINALGAYAMLCAMLNKPEAEAYKQTAKDMAAKWIAMADDGDHYRLTFDKPGTWSQKYNLVWDALFGLGLFPPEVAQKEVAYYIKTQNTYGIPLDNRKDYTKTDWLVWCATMASTTDDFRKLIEPLYRFCNETPDRIPFTDWYNTKTAKCIGFRARPVIGGIFIPLLRDALAGAPGTAIVLKEF